MTASPPHHGDHPEPGRVDANGLYVDPGQPGADGTVPLVLVHGVLDSARSFSRLRRSLGPRRRVVSYDRRGYQRSRPAQPVGTGVCGHTGDLLFVLDHYAAGAGGEGEGPRRRAVGAVVLGHSYGAVVALAAAARRPDLVAGVLAYEPPLSWLAWWPLGRGPVTGTRGGDGGDSPMLVPGPGEGAPEFTERFMRTMIGDRRYERLSPAARRGLADDGPAAAAELLGLPTRPAFDPAAVSVPVVVARGERATARHVRATDWLAAAVPGARLAVLGGADHGAHISHPAELARLLGELAARVEPSCELPR